MLCAAHSSSTQQCGLDLKKQQAKRWTHWEEGENEELQLVEVETLNVAAHDADKACEIPGYGCGIGLTVGVGSSS